MATISEELNKLETTKADIKSALVEKGLNPTDVFSSYALNIRDISTGGSSEPINAVSVNDSNYNSIVWPTNWADVKLIVFNNTLDSDLGYYNLPDLNIDLNYVSNDLLTPPPLIVFASLKTRLNWNLTVNVKDSDLRSDYPPLFSEYNYHRNYDSYGKKAIFNITFNGNNIPKRANYLFNGLYGNINITINNAPMTSCGALFLESYLDSFSFTGLDTSSCTNFSMMFFNANLADSSKFSTFPSIDTSKGTYFERMFSSCNMFLEIPALDTSNGTSFEGIVGNSAVIKLHEISFKQLTASGNYGIFSYYENNTLRYALIKDIGTLSSFTTLKMSYGKNWGVEDASIPLSAGARQSVIDSLITYSFDRAAAGYEACNIQLSANTKALLTEEEIAQITAKGYTIV